MSVSVEIDNESFEEVEEKLESLLGREVLDQFYHGASARAHSDVIRNFESERGSDGNRWERWKNPNGPGRVSIRPTKRGGTKMLQDKGRLKGSLVPYVEDSEAGVKTDVEYARRHNDGTKDMPKREFMYLSENAEEDIQSLLLEEITKVWGE